MTQEKASPEIVGILRALASKGKYFCEQKEDNDKLGSRVLTYRETSKIGHEYKNGNIVVREYDWNRRFGEHDSGVHASQDKFLEVEVDGQMVFQAQAALQSGCGPLSLIAPEPKEFLVEVNKPGSWLKKLQKLSKTD
jgi:hypothetical protein